MDWNFPVFGEDTTLTESTPVRSTANAGDLRVEPTNLDKSPNITNIIPPSGFQALPDMTAPMSSGQCSSSSTSIEEPELAISEFMEADLYVSFGKYLHKLSGWLTAPCSDQLYFDRIHTFIPILHQRRYFSWRRQPGKSDSQICLQYVIWTMAASVSAHHQSLGGGLYGCARRRLAQLDSKDIEPGSNPVEEAQAWLLIAIHELMGVDFRRGWISAGRAFRLMQINWFHEPDIIDGVPLPADWVELEQKRITFWMGYCFDRFISAQTGSLFTFNEQVRSAPFYIESPANGVRSQLDFHHPITIIKTTSPHSQASSPKP